MDERIKCPEKKYFAASNSANGFMNYYGECFGEGSGIEHLYVIKGGPGTGKSRLMREVAEAAEQKGYEVEYYYCSSDPTSLDGVRLTRGGARPRCIGVIDGTAPHAWEPILPGVRENIINLGDFWNSAQLNAEADRIKQLTAMKKQCYERAYHYLRACGELTRAADRLMSPCVLHSKIHSLAQRILKPLPPGSAFTSEPALQNALGMTGRVHFSTFEEQATVLYRADAYYGAEYRITEALLTQSQKKQLAVRISYDPIYPWRIDGLFWPESRLAVVVSPNCSDMPEHRRIYSAQYADAEKIKACRPSLRHAKNCEKSLLAGAEDCLAQVARYHFELEEIYITAMNFNAKEAFTKQFCREALM